MCYNSVMEALEPINLVNMMLGSTLAKQAFVILDWQKEKKKYNFEPFQTICDHFSRYYFCLNTDSFANPSKALLLCFQKCYHML